MKKKNKNQIGVLYIRGIPENTKNFFKAACIKRKITMTQKITELMKEWIEKESKGVKI